jgi:putative intracellular protease/amidase
MANMCNDPAVSSARPTPSEAPARHEVAVLALPGSIAFELGLPHRLLGSAVDAEGHPLYRVRVATLDGGPVRTSAGFTLDPEHDGSLLETAGTVVVPGVQGGPAMTEGRVDDALAAALQRAATHARVVSICTGAFVLPRPGCSTAGRRRRTGCTPRGSGRSSPPCGWTPTSCSSTTATCSPPPATRPGST